MSVSNICEFFRSYTQFDLANFVSTCLKKDNLNLLYYYISCYEICKPQICHKYFTVSDMVPTLDGKSELVAHTRRKIGGFGAEKIRFVTALDLMSVPYRDQIIKFALCMP